MPKRQSDTYITDRGVERNPDADSDDTDPVAVVFFLVKDREKDEQSREFEAWLQNEYRGNEESQALRTRFKQLQENYVNNNSMNRRATDAQMARRKMATPKGRVRQPPGAPSTAGFNLGAPQQSQPSFGGFSQNAQQNGGFNFSIGGNSQPAPNFGATPTAPASSAPAQNGGFTFGGALGQSQQQPGADAQQQPAPSQPNGIFSGFGTGAQTPSSNPFGSGSTSFTFGQTPSSQPQQPPQTPFGGPTSQSFGALPTSTAGSIFGGVFGQTTSGPETAQTSQPKPSNSSTFKFGQQVSAQAPAVQPAPIFNLSQPASTGSSGFNFGATTTQAPVASSSGLSTGGFNWGASTSAATTTQSSSTIFKGPTSTSPTAADTPKPAPSFGSSLAPSFDLGGPRSSPTQHESTSVPAKAPKPASPWNFGQSQQNTPQEEQQKSFLPAAVQQPSVLPATLSSDQAVTPSAASLKARREWYDAFDAKLGVTRQTNPLADQAEVLSLFTPLWKADKKADQQLSTSTPVTVADTAPKSPAKTQPSPTKQAPLPSSPSKYERPFEQVTLDAWKLFSKEEKLSTVQGAFKFKVAACEPDSSMLSLTDSFVKTWNQINDGDDSAVRAMHGETQKTLTTSTASQQSAPAATPAVPRPAGGLFAAGGFGGFSTPQPAFNKTSVQEAPKTVAAPMGSQPRDRLPSALGANKRKASHEDINTDSAKKSREESSSNLFSKANSSRTNTDAGSTQTARFNFKDASSSTPFSSLLATQPAVASASSNTASLFDEIVQRQSDLPLASPLKSNPFGSVSTKSASFTKPSTDTAPSDPSIFGLSANSPFKPSQLPTFTPSSNSDLTPFNGAKTDLFGSSSPSKIGDPNEATKRPFTFSSTQSPAKETAAAGNTAGATLSNGNARSSGGLFGFGNIAPPATQSTPQTGGLLNFNKQPAAMNGLGSAPSKSSHSDVTAKENGSVEMPKSNPFANLLGSKTAPIQKTAMFEKSDDNSGSVFNSPNLKPTTSGNNIFGHLSDVESLSGGKRSDVNSPVEISDDDDDEELDPDEAGDLLDGDEEERTEADETDDESQGNGSLAVQPPSLLTKKRAGPFADDDTEESEQEQAPRRRRHASSPEKSAPTSTPTTGKGGLFDRISYDKDGKPEREATEGDTTPKDATSNIFGLPQSSSLSSGTSLFANLNKNSPVGDHTWKPESPIKFSESTNAGNATTPKPLFNFSPATPSTATDDKENASDATPKPFSTLFGKTATTPSGSTATPLQPAANPSVGFNFGLAPPTGTTSLFTNSGVTSRATTPGASSAVDTDAEEEEMPKDEQNDLMGLGAMRDANNIEFETEKASAHKLVDGQWQKLGVGPVFVLKDKKEGVRSVRLIADGVGRVLLSSRIGSNNGAKVLKEKQALFVAPGVGNVSVRFRTPEDAERFVEACNKEV